jgi:hypothetical protein
VDGHSVCAFAVFSSNAALLFLSNCWNGVAVSGADANSLGQERAAVCVWTGNIFGAEAGAETVFTAICRYACLCPKLTRDQRERSLAT